MRLRWARVLAWVLGCLAVLVAAELALRVRYRLRVLPPAPPDPDTTIVVALGDSIVAGEPGAQDAAWPARLAAHLAAAYPNHHWRVVNAGVPGDTAPLGFARFEADVARERPDVVLIAFGLNDCHPARYGLDRWLEEQTPSGFARTYLWHAFQVRAERLARRLGWASGQPMVETRVQPVPRTSPEGFSAVLAALIDRASAIGAQPVLLTMTPLADTEAAGAQARRNTHPAYNARVRDLAARTGLPIVELAAGAPDGAIAPDGFHLTGVGQDWVAAEVFAQLAEAGFWDAAVSRRGR